MKPWICEPSREVLVARKAPVSAQWCAQQWGVSAAHARRILAQVEPVGQDPLTRAMLYDQAAARRARAAMPGRGARTDLVGKPFRHGASGYRSGCPCSTCRMGRAELEADRRHQARYGPDGPVNAAVRHRIVQHVWRGLSVAVAARRCGLSYQTVYGAAKALPEFRTELDRAIRPAR